MNNKELLEILIRATDEASEPLKKIAESLEHAGKKGIDFGGMMKTVGLALAGVTLALGVAAIGFGVLSTKMAAEFQDTLMKTSSNLDLNAKQTKELSAGIKQIMMISPSGMNDIAEAYRTAGSEGFNLAQSTELITETSKAAMVTGDNVASITNAVSIAMHDYGAKSSQTAEYLGDLHGAMVAGNITMEQLSPNIGILANTTALAGMSFKEAMAAMALMTSHGASASESVTSINNALMKLEVPTKAARNAMNALRATTGVDLVGDFEKVRNHTMSFEDAMKDLNKATGGNLEVLHGVMPEIRGLRFLMADAATGGKEFADKMKTVEDGQNALKTSYEASGDNLTILTGILQNNLNVAMIELGTTLLPYVIKAVQWLTKEWKEHREQITQVIQWIAAKIPEVFSYLSKVIEDFKINTLPGLIATWQKLVDNFNWFLQNVWPIIVKAFTDIGKNIMDNLWPAIKELWKSIMELWNLISPILIPILKLIAILIGGLVYIAIQGFIFGLTELIKWVKGLIDWVKQASQHMIDFGNFITDAWNSAWKSIDFALQKVFKINLLDVGKNIIGGLIDGIVFGARLLNSTLGYIAEDIGNTLKNALGIHSPSRVTMEIGHNVSEGMALGISQNKNVGVATAKLSSSIIQPLSQVASQTSQSTNNNTTSQSTVIQFNFPSQPIILNDQSLAEFAKRAKRAFAGQGFALN